MTTPPPSLPRILFHLLTQTYTALLPTPSVAIILPASPSATPTTLHLSAGVLHLPGGSISLATNGIVTMPSNGGRVEVKGQRTTTVIAKVATVSVGTRVVTAVVTTGIPSSGGYGGAGWTVEGNRMVTTQAEGLVVESLLPYPTGGAGGGGAAGGGGKKKKTVPWGTTTIVRVVNGEGPTNGGGGGRGKGSKGSFYQVGTRLYSAVPGGGQVVGKEDGVGPTGTAVASGGDGEEVLSGGEGSSGGGVVTTTTQMVTTTEKEVVTITAAPSVGSTSSAERMISSRLDGMEKIVIRVVVLGSFLVGVGCL